MQQNLLISNFWEDIKENLKTFSEVGNDKSKDTSLELLNMFNIRDEYFGDFDTLLTKILHMFVDDESIRSLFAYDQNQEITLISFLAKDFEKVAELSETKLKDTVNKALQVWRQKKESTEIIEQKAMQESAEKAMVLNKIDASTLADFGQKIGGAKKDTYSLYSDIDSSLIETKPLSKSFPEPDYKKLIADGSLSISSALLVKWYYSKIPSKPRKPYRLKKWVETVNSVVGLLLALLISDSDNVALRYKETLPNRMRDELDMFTQIYLQLGFPDNDFKLGDYFIKKFARGKEGVGRMSPDMAEGRDGYTYMYSIVFGGWKIVQDFDTVEQAIDGLGLLFKLKAKAKEEAKNTPTGKVTKLACFRENATKKYFIGKKTATGVYRLMEGFETSKEVQDYFKENQDKLQEMWRAVSAPVRERPAINKDRIGVTWRTENENITSEKLSESFGFRGIEYGNYVNLKERQDHVNNAYDALMDMANAIGISTEKLALNGQLALAFGARGSGNAMAHYEPSRTVINLTKNKGAGSLAHEYWHALDNYFAKKRRSDTFTNYTYVTEYPRVRRERSGELESSLHPEIVEAFKAIMDTIKSTGIVKRSERLDSTKSKLYWSTPYELSARCFENFIITKLGASDTKNDYLANFSAMGDWASGGLEMETYPYPLSDEEAVINEAYQQFFDVLKRIGME